MRENIGSFGGLALIECKEYYLKAGRTLEEMDDCSEHFNVGRILRDLCSSSISESTLIFRELREQIKSSLIFGKIGKTFGITALRKIKGF